MKLKFNEIALIILLVNLLSFATTSNPEYFCENRIYDPNEYLKMNDIKSLCLKIKNPAFFMINIQKHSSDPNDNSRRQFSTMCTKLHLCKNGAIISLYVDDHKSVIYVGSKVHSQIPIKMRTEILNRDQTKLHLRNGKFGLAAEKIVEELIDKFYSSLKNSNLKFPNYNVKNKYYDNNEQKNINTNNNVPVILSVFIIMGLSLCLFYLVAQKCNEIESSKPSLREDHINYNNEEKEEIREHLNFLNKILFDIKKTPNKLIQIDFCLLCMENFIPNKDNYNSTVRKFDCGHLYHYECAAEFNACLMCKGCKEPSQNFISQQFTQQQYPQQQYPQQQYPQQQYPQQQYPQQHYPQQTNIYNPNQYAQNIPNTTPYPQSNIPTFNEISPQINPIQNNNQASSYPNLSPSFQTNQFVSQDFKYFVTEANVLRLIENFKEIYQEQNLKKYYSENTQEVQKMQSDHGVGFSSMWGVAAGVGIGGLVGYGLGSYMNSGQNNTNNNQNFSNYPSHHNYNNSDYKNNNNYNNVADDDVDDYDGDAAEGGW